MRLQSATAQFVVPSKAGTSVFTNAHDTGFPLSYVNKRQ